MFSWKKQIASLLLNAFLTAFVSALFISNTLFARTIKDEHLKIILNKSDGQKQKDTTSKNLEKIWRKACDNLGNNLLIGRGPLGLGVFSSFECGIALDVSDTENKKETSWLLQISKTEEKVLLDLSFFDKKLFAIELPYTRNFLKIIADKKFSNLLALDVLNQMPMAARFEENMLKNNSIVTLKTPQDKNESEYKKLWPVKNLQLFHLDYNKRHKKWVSEVYGTATLREQKKPVWVLDNDAKTIIMKEKYLWAHNEKGPSKNKAKLRKKLLDIYDKLRPKDDVEKERIARNAPLAYIGFRYGYSLTSKPEILQKARLISVIAEISKGWLTGFQFAYDTVPSVKTLSNELETKLAWKRYSLGYSLGLNFSSVISRVYIAPKIGIWSLSAIMPIMLSDNSSFTKEFTLKNETSFSLEAGVEMRVTSQIGLKGWVAHDTASSLGKYVNATQVNSTQVGAHAIWKTNNNFGLALLGFWMNEYITLQTTSTPSTEDRIKINSMDLNISYSGLGLGLSW